MASSESTHGESDKRIFRMRLSKIQIRKALPILILLIGSYIVGFILVFSFCRPINPLKPPPNPTQPIDSGSCDSGESDGEVIDDEDTDQYHEGDAPPEVPPGRTPDGVFIDGAPLYHKCWDSDGTLYRFPACDSLEILEKRLSTRLYVIDLCKRSLVGDDIEGKLSLGIQVDFASQSLSAWSGPSSTFRDAKKIGTCVRRKLAGLPIYGIDHKLEKYRIFFTVEFRDAVKLKKELQKKRKQGRTLDVIKDRVRVRESPQDGIIIEKVSSDSQVTLLDRNNDWCLVLTPNDNEGWMICDALAL